MEAYVSYGTALLLNKWKFNENTHKHYLGDEIIEANTTDMSRYPERYIPAPTLQMAVSWIQEKYNILIVADYDYECTDTSWYYKIYKLGQFGEPVKVPVIGESYDKDGNAQQHIVGYRDYERSYKDYATREEAEQDGIWYVLENMV